MCGNANLKESQSKKGCVVWWRSLLSNALFVNELWPPNEQLVKCLMRALSIMEKISQRFQAHMNW